MTAHNRTFASLAASLDGYIASSDGDLSWLNNAMRRDEDYGLSQTMARAGAYIVGARTFRESAGMLATGDGPPIFVLTHAPAEEAPASVTFRGELHELVEQARSATTKDVHVFGGGNVVTQLISADLLDELTLALIPMLLGSGVRLFGELPSWAQLQLADCRSFPSGIVLLRYDRAA